MSNCLNLEVIAATINTIESIYAISEEIYFKIFPTALVPSGELFLTKKKSLTTPTCVTSITLSQYTIVNKVSHEIVQG